MLRKVRNHLQSSRKLNLTNVVLEAIKSRFWADSEAEFYSNLHALSASIEAHSVNLIDSLDGLRATHGAHWLGAVRGACFDIFDATIPIDDADNDRIVDVIAGRKMLGLMFAGFGKAGGALLNHLSQPPAETSGKLGRKRA